MLVFGRARQRSANRKQPNRTGRDENGMRSLQSPHEHQIADMEHPTDILGDTQVPHPGKVDKPYTTFNIIWELVCPLKMVARFASRSANPMFGRGRGFLLSFVPSFRIMFIPGSSDYARILPFGWCYTR